MNLEPTISVKITTSIDRNAKRFYDKKKDADETAEPMIPAKKDKKEKKDKSSKKAKKDKNK